MDARNLQNVANHGKSFDKSGVIDRLEEIQRQLQFLTTIVWENIKFRDGAISGFAYTLEDLTDKVDRVEKMILQGD